MLALEHVRLAPFLGPNGVVQHSHAIRVCSKIWLESHQGSCLIGPGSALLLKEIERRRSLAGAAKRLDISYRYAFKRVDLLNRRVGHVVTMKRGGAAHGSATLTALGKYLLCNYLLIEQEIKSTAAEIEERAELLCGPPPVP